MKEKWTLVKRNYWYLHRDGMDQLCPFWRRAPESGYCGTWCPAFQISTAPGHPESRYVLLNCMPRSACICLEKEEPHE